MQGAGWTVRGAWSREQDEDEDVAADDEDDAKDDAMIIIWAKCGLWL